jgi:hypothetical protein
VDRFDRAVLPVSKVDTASDCTPQGYEFYEISAPGPVYVLCPNACTYVWETAPALQLSRACK